MNDAQMIAKLFEYALNEPDQPAEDPVTQWFQEFATGDTLSPLVPGAVLDRYDEDAPSGREPDARIESPGVLVLVWMGESGGAEIQQFAHNVPVGVFRLHTHAVDDARGIARRKGVMGPRPVDGVPLSEAADMLGLSSKTLQAQYRNGRLRAVKRGRDLFVTLQEIDRYREFHQGRVGQSLEGQTNGASLD